MLNLGGAEHVAFGIAGHSSNESDVATEQWCAYRWSTVHVEGLTGEWTFLPIFELKFACLHPQNHCLVKDIILLIEEIQKPPGMFKTL